MNQLNMTSFHENAPSWQISKEFIFPLIEGTTNGKSLAFEG